MARETRSAFRQRIWERDQGICGICAMPIVSLAQMDIDRIIPGFQNGQYEDDNVRAAHGTCNRIRGGRDGADNHRASLAQRPKVDAIKHVIMREADAVALRKIAYRYNLVSDSAAIRFAIHELARSIEEEERRTRAPAAPQPSTTGQEEP